MHMKQPRRSHNLLSLFAGPAEFAEPVDTPLQTTCAETYLYYDCVHCAICALQTIEGSYANHGSRTSVIGDDMVSETGAAFFQIAVHCSMDHKMKSYYTGQCS